MGEKVADGKLVSIALNFTNSEFSFHLISIKVPSTIWVRWVSVPQDWVDVSTLVDDRGLGVPNSILRLIASDKAKTEDACAKVWGKKTGRMWVGSSLLLVLEMKCIQGKLEYLGGSLDSYGSCADGLLVSFYATDWLEADNVLDLDEPRERGAGVWLQWIEKKRCSLLILPLDSGTGFHSELWYCQLSAIKKFTLSSKNAVFFHVSWDKVNTGLQHMYVCVYIYIHFFCATFMAVKSESNPSLEKTCCSPEALG